MKKGEEPVGDTELTGDIPPPGEGDADETEVGETDGDGEEEDTVGEADGE